MSERRVFNRRDGGLEIWTRNGPPQAPWRCTILSANEVDALVNGPTDALELQARCRNAGVASIIADGIDVGADTDEIAAALRAWILEGVENPFEAEAAEVSS